MEGDCKIEISFLPVRVKAGVERLRRAGDFSRQGAGSGNFPSGGGKGAVRACRAKGPLLLSHTSHPHILWGIRGTFAKSVVFAKVRCAAAAVLAASISPRHPLPPPLSLDEDRVGAYGQGRFYILNLLETVVQCNKSRCFQSLF